jgi:hypothetical protein
MCSQFMDKKMVDVRGFIDRETGGDDAQAWLILHLGVGERPRKQALYDRADSRRPLECC